MDYIRRWVGMRQWDKMVFGDGLGLGTWRVRWDGEKGREGIPGRTNVSPATGIGL